MRHGGERYRRPLSLEERLRDGESVLSQIYCIFLFLCAASLFGTIIAQVHNAEQTIAKICSLLALQSDFHRSTRNTIRIGYLALFLEMQYICLWIRTCDAHAPWQLHIVRAGASHNPHWGADA